MSYEFETAMKVLREKANKAAYDGQASMRVPLSMLLGILGRAEEWPELTRLRAVNAELVETLKELQRCAQKQGFNDKYETTMKCVQAVLSRAALSRAEQAKPETKTCVWTARKSGWVLQCGGPTSMWGAPPEICPDCRKKVEVKK